ncbi:MAG: hypothetical protein ACLGJD_12280 [Gammaproteobacteria bacterium]
MSAAHLVNVCPVCGAEESLDGLLARMIDDEEARGLIADVIATSLPLGQDVLRYLRLHKPAKQKLRMATARKVLAELVPDVQRAAIQRHGRTWLVTPESWRLALQAVFDNVGRGAVTLPLDGNAYLYAVLTRMVDREEARQEKTDEVALRGRAHQAGAVGVGEALQAVAAPALPASEPEPAPADPEAAAKAETIREQLRRDLAAKRARQSAEELRP